MPNNFGLTYHVIVDGLDSNDLSDLLVHLRDLQPAWINITGGSRFKEAMQFVELLKRECPDINVILRQYSTGGINDGGVSSRLTPQQWYSLWVEPIRDWLKIWKPYYMTDNEGFVGGTAMLDYSQWMADVIKLCYPDGIRLAVGRFPTGIPDLQDYKYLRTMFEALASYGGVWSPNEYFGQTPQLSNSLPGRFVNGLKFCDEENIKRPTVVIGEYGLAFAKLGDRGEIVLDPDKGYEWLGWTQEKFFDEAVSYYEPWIQPFGAAVCFFAFGAINEFRSFNFGQPFFAKAKSYKDNGKGVVPVTQSPTPNPPKETAVEGAIDWYSPRWTLCDIEPKVPNTKVNIRIRPSSIGNTPLGLITTKKQGYVVTDPTWGTWGQVRYGDLFGWADLSNLTITSQAAFVSISKADYDTAISNLTQADQLIVDALEKLI